jgi:hypothetical protein
VEVMWEKSLAVRNLRLKARSVTDSRKKSAVNKISLLIAATEFDYLLTNVAISKGVPYNQNRRKPYPVLYFLYTVCTSFLVGFQQKKTFSS